MSWIVYSIMTYVALWAASAFKANDLYSWFLVGAIYGWLGEGVIVQTMYDVFPLNISFTGLAWHSLISVVWGWYYFRKVIHTGSTKKILKNVIGIGLFFGFWAPTWWWEAGFMLPIEDFASYIVFFTIPTVFFFILYEKISVKEFVPSKIEKILVCGFFIFLFVFGTIPLVGILSISLPILLYIVIWALKQHRMNQLSEISAEYREMPTTVPVYRYFWFFLVPFIAIGEVILFASAQLIIQTSIYVFLVTMPAGFILFVASIRAIVKKNRKVTTI